MAETQYNLDRDLAEAEAMAAGLEDYVRGDRVYGTVGGGGMFASDVDMPSLTIGALLLRLRRLAAQQGAMNAAQRALLTQAEAEHERVRDAWRVHYNEKLLEEANARMRSMEAFLAECEDDPQTCAGAYLPEAFQRTILEEIVRALAGANMADADLRDALRRHDTQLRRFTDEAGFVWDAKLRPFYPAESYWWLYERPQEGEREGEET